MISKHLNTYFLNYFFILFVTGSFILRLAYNKTGLDLYYIIAAAVLFLSFTRYSVTRSLGLSFKLFRDKTLYFYLVPAIIFSNILLALITKNYMERVTDATSSDPIGIIIVSSIVFSSIRIFGEELVFRGILLIKDISSNKTLFWTINIIQGLLFGLIHYYIGFDVANPFVFAVYVFVLSVYFGWVNRKFNSLIPGWTIHMMNGIQTLVIAAMY